MWAILSNEDDSTIVGVLPPDVTKEMYDKCAKEHTLILCTVETGIGYIPGYYENGKFYKGKKVV
jgi:hypothetical protein